MKRLLIEILKFSAYGIFFALFLFILSQLFLEKETDGILNSVKNYFGDYEENSSKTLNELKVIYPEEPSSLDSTSLNPNIRQVLVNIYEPLVKLDRDLKIKPSLALSWGLIDDTTWEFKLRPNVSFHDGTSFESKDAVSSIDRAKKDEKSELFSLLSSINEFIIVDDLTFKIITKTSDPLLLQKLSLVSIVPSDYGPEDLLKPIGTGSYKFLSYQKGDKLSVAKFDNYWGDKAKFNKVDLYWKPNKSERVNMFLRGDADVLTFVPYDTVSIVKDKGFSITSFPTLEVQSLFFNFKSELLKNVDARKAISLAMDQQSLISKLGDYAKPVNQFVSNGIFGFSPSISGHAYDFQSAKKIAEAAGLSGKTLQVHLPKGLDILGEYVRKSLSGTGILTIISYLDPDKFLESLKNGDADVYFFGFRSELGDAVDFLNTVLYSKGEFNVFGYNNPNVDYLIEIALSDMDQNKRRDALQEAMEKVTQEDYVGIPLFEYETIFAFDNLVDINPRIDGLLYFDDIIVK